MKEFQKSAFFFLLPVLLIPFAIAVYNYHSGVSSFVWENFHIASVATALNPDDSTLRFEIGNYYFGGGAYNTEKAEDYFKKALEIDTNISGAHYQIARIYFVRGNFNSALGEINKEIERHPDFRRSHYVRGLVNGYSGRLAEAESDFEEFLKWKPESWAGWNDLAWVYFQEGKYKEARDSARRGLEIYPENPWLLNSLGVALLNTGQKYYAKEVFARALAAVSSMSPEDWGRAYPGNNPEIYTEGLSKMKQSMRDNLKLLEDVNI